MRRERVPHGDVKGWSVRGQPQVGELTPGSGGGECGGMRGERQESIESSSLVWTRTITTELHSTLAVHVVTPCG